MFINKHLMYAVFQQISGILSSSRASRDHTVHMVPYLRSHFQSFSDQLKYNRMDLPLLLLRIDQEISPLLFIPFIGLLLKTDGLLRAFSHTEPAHTAALADFNPVFFKFQRAERTDIHAYPAERAGFRIKIQKIHCFCPP